MLAASCSNSVDLPMPGSPLTSTTEPGTMPPPSTRLSSLPSTGTRSRPSEEIGVSGWGAPLPSMGTKPRAALRPAGASTTCFSISVFHSPQSGHLPIHLAWALPQFWQT